LGSQYFYLAGSGIQIYSYKKDFPDLKIGDYVEVKGELADSSAGRRIKTATKDDIKFIESQPAPAPHPITLAELEDYEGGLVAVSGTVLQISGRNIIIDDGEAEVKVYINSQIEFKDIGVKAGDKVAITGIVGKTASGYRLLPRDLADIKVEKGEVAGVYATSSPVDINSPAWYLGAIVAFLLGVIGIMFWKLRKKQ
jgi:lysyl-tRNA synthetase class II